jgi:hypothetical protein
MMRLVAAKQAARPSKINAGKVMAPEPHLWWYFDLSILGVAMRHR